MVEAFFRAAKTLLQTRLVLHKYDDTIRGHVFSSFLALLLRRELMSTLALRGEKPEWTDIVRDLAALQEVEVEQDGRRHRLRLPLQGGARYSRLWGLQRPRLSGCCNVLPRPFHIYANARYTGTVRNQL